MGAAMDFPFPVVDETTHELKVCRVEMPGHRDPVEAVVINGATMIIGLRLQCLTIADLLNMYRGTQT